MKTNIESNLATLSSLSSPAKIVVLGGTGLVGRQVVNLLRQEGHEVTAASPSRGVNSVTGEGLAEALQGARIVVDASNAASFEDNAVMEFFKTSTTRLVEAAKAAGVEHLIALSVVGTDRLQTAGYFRAKLVQENLIRDSGLPFTLLRATQFFEFIGSIAHASTVGEQVRLAPALLQPVAASDVALAVAEAALSGPVNGLVEIAGPEAAPMPEWVDQYLRAQGDARSVVADESAGYFGTPVDDQSLVPLGAARLGGMSFQEWLTRNTQAA